MASLNTSIPQAGFAALAAQQLLEHASTALFMLDTSGNLLWRNAHASEHLRDGSILFEDPAGRLALRSEPHQKQLAEFFPAKLDRLPPTGAVANQQESADDCWMLVLWPRDFGFSGAGLPGPGIVLAQFRKGVGPKPPDIRTLQTAFGFTTKEAGVAHALARGRDVEEHAADSGSTVATVRWHLKNALAKTHCRSQKQLVLLVNSLHFTLM
jgi:DNA-binding CsgD family transcriptional regulator